MKKVLVIFLALLIGLSMSAQIQRSFFGFTLGTTTKSEVYNKFKDTRDFFQYKHYYTASWVSFGGYDWWLANFYFHNDKLYSVELVSLGLFPSEYNEMWASLVKSLNKKYSQYKKTSEGRIKYFDKTTILTLDSKTITSSSLNERRIILTYTDIYLSNKKIIDEENEL